METTTVYFRDEAAPLRIGESCGTTIVFPSDPTVITYAVAFVDNIELTADKTGLITYNEYRARTLQR